MRKNWLLIGIGLLVSVLAIAAIGCGGDATTLTATLAEVQGSGVTGTATLTEANDGATKVVMEMAGVFGVHANHLHHGTCDAQGEVHVTLEEILAGGPLTNTFEEPELAHFETGHYVAVHEAGGAPGPVISCGNVE